MHSPYLNVLSISSHGREIPYLGSGIKQENGQTNHGFKNLITHPEFIEAIPELAFDQTMKVLVSSLNSRNSRFFTTGCFSHKTKEACNFRYSGYLEFAWNCQICVRDAINYLSLFFHFEQFLHIDKFDQKVRFKWLIQETQFRDVNIAGFCCAIFIDTACYSSCDQASGAWRASLIILNSFLGSVPIQSSTAIYQHCSTKLPHSKSSVSC